MVKIPALVSEKFKQIYNDCRNGKKVSAFGMQQYNRTLFAANLKGAIFVCPDIISARATLDELVDCTTAVMLPPKDDVLNYRKTTSGDNQEQRFFAMRQFICGHADVLVTTAEAIMQLYPQRERFNARIVQVNKGEQYDIADLTALMVSAGYRHEAQVSAPSQLSRRGDTLDIWAVGEKHGYRIEFFGDEVEKIKLFDLAEQITVAETESITVCPNTEIFLSQQEADAVIAALKQELRGSKISGEQRARLEGHVSDISLRLSAGDNAASLNFIMPLSPAANFFEFFKPTVVIFDDAKAVYDSLKVGFTEHESRYKSLLTSGEVYPSSYKQLSSSALEGNLGNANCAMVAFHKITSSNRLFNPEKVYNFSSMAISDYTRDYQTLCDDVKNWQQQGYAIHIYCGSDNVKDNMDSLFADNRVGHGDKSSTFLYNDSLEHGAIFHDEQLVVIGTYDITRKSRKKTLKRSKKDVFVEPSVGDYVVHSVHGIGICESVTKMEVNGCMRDYIVLRYRGEDRLYVPIENMDSLSKLVAGEEHPKLSKIGGADFSKLKDKVKASVKLMAINLLELYGERKKARGHAYSPDNALLDEFCADFPYVETEDQLTATQEGLTDLIDGKIMDRLLCGDVGYGKTEVALRLAFKVISEGKQVAFISPTTILAMQHFATCIKRMDKYGINVCALTRFVSAADSEKALEQLSLGTADIVVGTHRVLSKDVVFKDLGLLILDEEQRFGVADKEKIKTFKNNVNVLSLSATPIPRTLHMSMVGIRDISVLDTPPAERIPVQTYVSEYTDTLVADAINREVNRGGQVFVVFNRVAEIDKFASGLARMMPDIKFSVAHGQMNETMLENVINAFVAGQSDVLVASTIIENGIDIARANTMVVVGSDMLGLSQLYQLRGRVGRSNRLSYVYFTYDGDKVLTEQAYKRLDAITQFTEFGSGFKIAMRDLEIRGAGNILGREQHGHMEKVGYDMYCKLLESAVKELKGEFLPEQAEVKVFTDFNAFIPDTYVTDSAWRIRLYTKIARLSSKQDYDKLRADVEDIYGKAPDSVLNLIMMGLVKNLAAKMGATAVTLKKRECSITLAKIIDLSDVLVKLIGLTKEISLNAASSKIVFAAGSGSSKMLVNFLLNCIKK